MKMTIDPGKQRCSINVTEDICYSTVTDKKGNEVKLNLFLMLQNGNSEMRLADGTDDEFCPKKQPLIVWINGAGWRKCHKELMSAEMQFLADAGYAVAFIDYRNSELAAFPCQLHDVKTAVRFLRANAEEYGIDPQRIGTIGRSAGGNLSTWMAMNTSGFDTEEYANQSSEINVAVNLFGPADLTSFVNYNLAEIKKPEYRWHSMSQTHEGALLELNDEMKVEEMLKRAAIASPINYINEKMCPLTILHGDKDPLIPCKESEIFYDTLVVEGYEERVDLYIVKNGGHGTREFFQPMTKEIILKAFDNVLK